MKTIFIICLSAIMCGVMVVSRDIRLTSDDKYAIVFDAGSKGTRLYLYKYQSLRSKQTFDLEIPNLDYTISEILYCELNDDGLSSYPDESVVEENFNGCMSQARDLIPAEKIEKTYIALIATAGLRLLEFQNRELVEKILQEIRRYFKSSGFLYLSDSQVRIISGPEEGIFSLLASNYLLKQFDSDSTVPNENIYGVIDVGGASAQVAFFPKASNLNANYINNVRIQNTVYPLYSYSYLCFGTAQILTMYSMFNVRTSSYSNKIKASCYPVGYDFKYTGAEIQDSPCVNGAIFDSSYEFTIDKNLIDRSKTYTVSGDSKRNKCRDELDLILPRPSCPHGSNQCGFDGVYQPNIDNNRYLALGNLYEAIDLTNRLLNVNVHNNLTAFDEYTHYICQRTYDELRLLNTANNAGIGKNRIAKLCLEHNYLLKMLDAYGIKSLTNVFAMERVDGKKINWVLGVLIYDLNLNSADL